MNTKLDELADRFESFLKSGKLNASFEIKEIIDEGDLGKLRGYQFDSENFGGYLYFWSNGFLGIQYMNYQTMEEIIGDSLLESTEKNLAAYISEIESFLVLEN